MKKILLILILVLLTSVLGAYFFLKGKRYEVVITQEQIDAALAESFPATKSYLVLLQLTYSNPTVELLPKTGRIRVSLDATLNLRLNQEPNALGGGATVVTGIRFDPETQEFFLDDAVFERLEIEGVPEKWTDRVATLAAVAAQEFVQTRPVYQLEATDAKTRAATLLLKDVEVRDEAVYVTLGI